MRALLARLLALAALVAVLDDGSACLIALATGAAPGAPTELAWRAPCQCGCAHHSASTLTSVGLAQPAAPQALAAVPAPQRAPVPGAPAPAFASAPARPIDHVPIALA